MKQLILIMTAITLTIISVSVVADQKTQTKLDQACEKARDVKLAPLRKTIFEECVTKFKKSKDVCTAEAKDYNGNRINGAPMFYELPQCVKAFEYRKTWKR